MDFYRKSFSVFLILTSMAFPAFAGEAQYGPTIEFLNVCDVGENTQDAIEKRFIAEGWEAASEDIKDALLPDDFMKSVRSARAYKVELQDGGMWLALTARGKLGKKKQAYCSVTVIDNDPDGYRQDFEQAKGLSLSKVADSDMEKRFAISANDGSDSTYVMREIRSPDLSYFTYIKVSP